MEKITQPAPGKRDPLRTIKRLAVRVWNACLPNFIDFRISTHIGPLFIALVEIETDCEYQNYRPRLEPYMPKVALLSISWEKARFSHFSGERCLIGYQLSSYEGKKGKTEYYHIFSILFYDFWFRAKGPLRLKITP